MSYRRIILGVAAVFVFAGAGICFAATITVNWDGTADYTTIRAAIDAAAYGDTIEVSSGTYIENITLKNGVKLTGDDPVDTIIDGNQNGSVVKSKGCDPNTVMSRFRITNGLASLGGGIYNISSSPTIIDCTFSWNSATAHR